jgi:cysteine desulfurase family protein (TIGR01976 family)
VNAGEVLAFDYRVLHRALHHGGSQPRPLLYYTFTKRWFSDAMNFADLPSLRQADGLPSRGLEGCRSQFPALQALGQGVVCDGAAGSQVPGTVIARMGQHLATLGATNVGGDYPTSQSVLDTVSRARAAGARLLGAASPGEVAFGPNCSGLLFHLARAVERGPGLQPGDNLVLSGACHDANIAPWLLLADRMQLEVRWLAARGGPEDALRDELVTESVGDLIDARTRVVALGLASNATGRVHTAALERVRGEAARQPSRPLLVLDLTHYAPHRRVDLKELGADVVVCSSYKFFGPHLGLMAFDRERLAGLRPAKVGLRFGAGGGVTDLLDCGEVPSRDNCEISRWEMGTLNYEALAGLEACVDYLSSLAPAAEPPSLNGGLAEVRRHEEQLSERFLAGLRPLLAAGRLRLLGTRDPAHRTPTFALAAAGPDPQQLVRGLTGRGVRCTHGNHYAVGLVEQGLGEPEGVTRLSFMHYNTLEEVDRVVAVLADICG